MIGTLSAADLRPDTAELAARLQSPLPVRGTEEYLARLRQAINCRYLALRVPILREETKPDLGFGQFESRALSALLEGCKEAFLFAVTLGLETDRLLMRLSATDTTGHFITDALASALAESAADLAQAKIAGDLCCTRRFSPGYGDLDLALQRPLLALLQSQRIGLTLNQNLLMVPTKSITAIMGIKQ